MKPIKQSVINTLNRVGINYQPLLERTDKVSIVNRFSGEACETTPLVAFLINWVYQTSNEYEEGIQTVKVSDFDRIRYFVLDQDSNAYMTCLD